MNRSFFIVSREDWSLHRKGYLDQSRHQQKIRDAIKSNLPDLISEESIILSNGKQIVKIPIRNLDEYRFRFNYQQNKNVGQGDGNSRKGDVIGVDPASSDKGAGKGAGDQQGQEIYEAEVSLEDIENSLFEELELPYLQEKEKDQLTATSYRFNDIRKKGIVANIDKKRTILENIKRNARQGHSGIHNIQPEDLRYKTWEEITAPQSNAVILAMMDTSGSMGPHEKYLSRCFFFWMTRFLRSKYEHVEIVFIAHHTEAKEVSEEEFFHKGESGGTICSSAYLKALEVIHDRYPPHRYNIYPFHISDGDNLTSDNERCTKLIAELLQKCNMFGYGEINQYNRNSTLMSAYRQLQLPHFQYTVMRDRKDVYSALKTFFYWPQARKER